MGPGNIYNYFGEGYHHPHMKKITYKKNLIIMKSRIWQLLMFVKPNSFRNLH